MFNKPIKSLFACLPILSVLIATTYSCHADTPKRLIQTAKFSIPHQAQVTKFVATKKAVYASVQYLSPSSRYHKSAMAAWDTKGKLLWRMESKDAYYAYQLTLADSQLIMAYDDKTNAQGGKESGIIWIDVGTGKENHRIIIEGRPRPFDSHYFPREKVYVLYMHPMQSGDEAQVLAYDMQGNLVWARKLRLWNYQFLKADGKYLVLGDPYTEKSLQRVNPANGATIWKKPWENFSQYFDETPIEKRVANPNLSRLVYVPHEGGASNGNWPKNKDWGEFLELENGKTVAKVKWPDMPPPTQPYRSVLITPLGSDRLYHQWHDLNGVTLAAINFSSGLLIWAVPTNTVSYNKPVQWDDKVVFMCRRLTKGLTGAVSVVEMRIYDRDGDLIVHDVTKYDPADRNQFWFWGDTVPVQAVGKKLYAVKGNVLLSLTLSP